MTVAEAQDRIDSAEFAEWLVHYLEDPWDARRLEAAIVTQKPYQPPAAPKPPPTFEQVASIFRILSGNV